MKIVENEIKLEFTGYKALEEKIDSLHDEDIIPEMAYEIIKHALKRRHHNEEGKDTVFQLNIKPLEKEGEEPVNVVNVTYLPKEPRVAPAAIVNPIVPLPLVVF